MNQAISAGFSVLIWMVTTLFLLAFGMFWTYRDIPAQFLEQKYGAASSQFLTLDGVQFHYRDEGPREGPAVILIHAHWASLIMWDSWADALKDKYRVIRFDMAGHGLTGPDPSGDYSIGRGVELFELFVNKLDVREFDLIGTSLGGTHAIHFTSQHPDIVKRLVLLNPGALNAGVRGRDTPRELPWWIDIMAVVTPKAFFQFMLSSGFGNPDQLDDRIVTRWHDLQLREGQREAEIERNRQYVSGDIEAKIRSLASSTLVMWGEANPVVTVDQAYEFIDLLTNAAEKKLAIYPGLGHMAALEDPMRTGVDIRSFLDGEELSTVIQLVNDESH